MSSNYNFDNILALINECTGFSLEYDYDGIIVKQLKSSNILYKKNGTSHQTHIAITGKQIDIFPFINSSSYYEADYESSDSTMKSYFTLKMPICIYRKNCLTLVRNDNFDVDQIFNQHPFLNIYVCGQISKRNNQTPQYQLSILSYDSPQFVSFRKLISEDDVLVILKRKSIFSYDFLCFSSKSTEAYKLLQFNNQFFNRKTVTVIYTDELSNSYNTKSGGKNVLIYGVPGSGKSYYIANNYCNDEKYIERVVFYSDYSYSDFVGQIQPTISNDSKNLYYEFIPGPFTSILKKAINDPTNNYYLIIEEINRGNAPAIFGDIFQLLDRKESGDNTNGESQYSITNKDISKLIYNADDKHIKIPGNLWILATMNSSDQNVFLLDTAFQRRWTMKNVKNDVYAVSYADQNIENSCISWAGFVSTANYFIIQSNTGLTSSEDKQIGAYFASKKELSINLFPEKVLKYLWDDALKYDRQVFFKQEILSFNQLLTFYNKNGDCIENVVLPSIFLMMKNAKNNDDIVLQEI